MVRWVRREPCDPARPFSSEQPAFAQLVGRALVHHAHRPGKCTEEWGAPEKQMRSYREYYSILHWKGEHGLPKKRVRETELQNRKHWRKCLGLFVDVRLLPTLHTPLSGLFDLSPSIVIPSTFLHSPINFDFSCFVKHFLDWFDPDRHMLFLLLEVTSPSFMHR